MSALRLVATAVIAAAVAALGAGLADRRPAATAPARAAALRAIPAVAASPAPAEAPAVREGVPPEILSRAAGARALERAGCPGAAKGGDCGGPSEPVEIDWDVRRDR